MGSQRVGQDLVTEQQHAMGVWVEGLVCKGPFFASNYIPLCLLFLICKGARIIIHSQILRIFQKSMKHPGNSGVLNLLPECKKIHFLTIMY